ncbi:hypothetical protein J1605_018259 [Eschrichtius robustus]|uniref:Uncharacterized protein n=1 Tax=Eschrichtius robustus TaxID=9764 RepID=A0AB34HWI2_ESCRO|nr:hypothetical protein J1605_018259 [Eschrichtius robustus]
MQLPYCSIWLVSNSWMLPRALHSDLIFDNVILKGFLHSDTYREETVSTWNLLIPIENYLVSISSPCSRGPRQRQPSGKAGRATTAARQSHEGAGFEDSVPFYYKAAMAGRRHPAHCEALPAAPRTFLTLSSQFARRTV